MNFNKEKLENLIKKVEKIISETDDVVTRNNLIRFRQSLVSATDKSSIHSANKLLIRYFVDSFETDSNLYQQIDEITEEADQLSN